MNEAEFEERVHLLQQELALTGEALERLRRDHRAEIDTLRLEVEVLQRCLSHLHPDELGEIDRIRDEAIQQVDPEAT